MSEIRSLFTQSTHYFGGHALIMASGLISFPIITRIFSVGDYGILGLISTTMFILIALSKLGLPNSIVRFYAEFKAKKELPNFFSTMILGTAVLGAGIAILMSLLGQIVPETLLTRNNANLLSLAAVIIFTTCTGNIFTSFLRAEQKTKLYNLIEVAWRFGSLTLSIFFVFYLIRGLPGFFFGQVVAGAGILLFLFFYFLNKKELRKGRFCSDIFKSTMKFGFPLIWAELGHLFLNYVDRYLIQIFLGSISLGLYTAGYNLATHVTDVIIYPINYAMTPIYMGILINKGEKETKDFFTQLFRFFLLFIAPIILGFIAIGENLIGILASKKYLEANAVLPYVIVGQAVYACTIILNSGLFISKKTYVVTYAILGSCLLKIGLNIFLIPKFGIVGAGQATLASFVLYGIVITYYAFKEFRFKIDYAHILIYLGAALIMFLLIRNIDFGGHVVDLIAKMGIGVISYSFLVFFGDGEIRNYLRNGGWYLKRGGQRDLAKRVQS